MIVATRYHDISCGHRVVGHESKCAYIHGHNYRLHFTCRGNLDAVGRVLDFGTMKSRLCMWPENNWDHRFLAWDRDDVMKDLIVYGNDIEKNRIIDTSMVWVPFNPTAENMAEHLLRIVGPDCLAGSGVELIEVCVEETRRCSATASL